LGLGSPVHEKRSLEQQGEEVLTLHLGDTLRHVREQERHPFLPEPKVEYTILGRILLKHLDTRPNHLELLFHICLTIRFVSVMFTARPGREDRDSRYVSTTMTCGCQSWPRACGLGSSASLEFRIWGLGFRVQGSGFRFQGSGFRV